jgi:hypothetical protein
MLEDRSRPHKGRSPGVGLDFRLRGGRSGVPVPGASVRRQARYVPRHRSPDRAAVPTSAVNDRAVALRESASLTAASRRLRTCERKGVRARATASAGATARPAAGAKSGSARSCATSAASCAAAPNTSKCITSSRSPTAARTSCRSTRSGRRSVRGSGLVVRHGPPLRLAPWIPWARISRWTRPRPTVSPARLSAFHMRR